MTLNPISAFLNRTWLIGCLMFGLFVIAMIFPAISFQSGMRAGISVTPASATAVESPGGQAVADELSLLDVKLADCMAKLTGVTSVAGNRAADIKVRVAWLHDRLVLLVNQTQSLAPVNQSARQNRNLPRLLKEAARLRSEVAFIEKLVGQQDGAAPRATAQAPIKLAPQGTGTISGTVTDTQTLLPISGISVVIYDVDNNLITIAPTDGSGNFTTAATLDTGTYYALTSNGQGYLDKLYNNITCTNCLPNGGTPIAVTSGVATTSINFALTPGSKISGNIKDATTMANLQNITVTVYDSEGNTVAIAVSNASGNYTTSQGLAAGTYYARTTNNTAGYINQIYNGAPCVVCPLGSGTPIPVPTATTVTGINFALTAGGRISGTVTNAATSAPFPNVIVNFYTSSGAFATNTKTDCAGNFTCDDGLTTGSYFVRTANTQGFVDQLYSNLPCINCDPTTGTSVAVTAGANTPGINLSLCHMALSSASAYFSTAGSEGSFNLLTSAGCSWTAASNSSWLEVTSAPSGTGNTTINYTVRDNFSLLPRVGTISVAGLTFTVTQDSESAPECTYNIAPAFAAYSASGGTGSLAVIAEERCAWQSSSNVSWITIASNCCGVGNGAVSYTVAPNPGGASRAGVITVAGKTFAVKQKGH